MCKLKKLSNTPKKSTGDAADESDEEENPLWMDNAEPQSNVAPSDKVKGVREVKQQRKRQHGKMDDDDEDEGHGDAVPAGM